MPPRRASAGGKATPTSARSHKRRISETLTTRGTTSNTPGSRISKRLKDSAHTQAKATPTKSKYFEGSDLDDEGDVESIDNDSGDSGYEDEQVSMADASDTNASGDDDEDEDEDDFDSDENPKAQKKKKGPARSSGANAKDLWRPGVKTGLGPGKEVFIEKPKPRGDGGIKYEPDKIHPNTLEFLRDLKKNNDREWLKSRSRLF